MWLTPADRRMLTPNRYEAADPRAWAVKPVECVVLHYTGGYSATSSARWLANPEAKASAHLVVARDGDVWQLAPLSDRCWHAGSRAPGAGWRGRSVNAISIGIELANLGLLHRAGDRWIDGWGKPYTGPVHPNPLPLSGDLYSSEIRRLREGLGLESPEGTHGAPFAEIAWEPYPDAQVDAAIALVHELVEVFPLISLFDTGTPRICGHSDVDPSRKIDPGPAFPIERVREAVAAANLGECLP